MNWDVELAKQFKVRDNASPFEPLLGDVISSVPIKVSILSNKVILDNRNSYLCTSALSVQVGDKVLCIPTEDGQKFFIIDKVVV